MQQARRQSVAEVKHGGKSYEQKRPFVALHGSDGFIEMECRHHRHAAREEVHARDGVRYVLLYCAKKFHCCMMLFFQTGDRRYSAYCLVADFDENFSVDR